MSESNTQEKLNALRYASGRQNEASNPMKSVWVGASAGTGKTKVLIDRVLRLMLPREGMDADSASPPEKILCLTYTKTAAAEMSNRIYKRLGEWAVMPEDALRAVLSKLMDAAPTHETERAARRLFAQVLDVPGGLNIMTIHSFCQSVLKRFPVEAGIPPHFELLDEEMAKEYLGKCLQRVIALARHDKQSVIAQSFSELVLLKNADDMTSLMSDMMAKRSKLFAVLKAHGDEEGDAQNTVEAVYRALGVAQSDTEDSLLRAVGDIPLAHEANLRQVLQALLAGGGTRDAEKASVIQAWLESPTSRMRLFDDYCTAFFTNKGERRSEKTLVTKSAEAVFPDIKRVMLDETVRLERVILKRKSLRLAKINAALLTLSARMVGDYESFKRETDRLDYDDLILKTRALLAQEGDAAWVRFKLDNGIDHILLDEAQDTGPEQWQVIEALCGDFFSGSGARDDVLRTLFVVGDEKQSIYSFQGADPYGFGAYKQAFGGQALQIQEGWEVLLEHSFRSTHTVLRLVDEIFERGRRARHGVVFEAERELRHLPIREGHGGRVELWPLFLSGREENEAAWNLPTEVEKGDDARTRLAQYMAQTIRQWLDTKELLPSKNRPLRAGDVLILVQSRGVFVETILRALKDHGVPVSGVDRMVLTQEIAVMDLLALAQFCLQPRDDLTLATVLKSPLLGLDEDGLLDVCKSREGSGLWNVLQKKRPELADYLARWRENSASATPYAFFAEILAMATASGYSSGRKAFYARLGLDIQDALDEFLNRCLHFEQSHTPSLQTFVDWFLKGEAQIKREQEQAKHDEVRIMTVHASKGLQAPVVILPDAARIMHDHNRGRIRMVWPEEADTAADVPLWAPSNDYAVPLFEERVEPLRARQNEEYRRLLYVALTRAEDRLYIAGSLGKRSDKLPEESWYSLIQEAFPQDAERIPLKDNADEYILRLEHLQTAAVRSEPEAEKAETPVEPLPSWALTPPMQEEAATMPLAPSRMEEEPSVRSPLAGDENARFQRGNILHKILETVPALPLDKREAAIRRYLARPAFDLSEEQRHVFLREVMTVLQHPEFAPIFGAGSQAEVPVTGVLTRGGERSLVMAGQMDRVLVTDTEVLIVDYKTNRPPPVRVEDVPAVYLKQMATYRAVMKSVYPRHTIKCALLWTDVACLMPVPDALMADYS